MCCIYIYYCTILSTDERGREREGERARERKERERERERERDRERERERQRERERERERETERDREGEGAERERGEAGDTVNVVGLQYYYMPVCLWGPPSKVGTDGSMEPLDPG